MVSWKKLTILNYISHLGFSDSFDDSWLGTKHEGSNDAEDTQGELVEPDKKKDGNKIETDDSGKEEADDSGKEEADDSTKELDDDSDFQIRAKNVFRKYGIAFIQDVLPKLPTMPNEMILLGCNERSPLHECGELFKMRVFRPDRPTKYSEIFEDGSVMRFTNIARLLNEDMMVFKFKLEAATLKVGVIDDDMTGVNATPGLLESDDVCNLTIRPFMERKIKGKIIKS